MEDRLITVAIHTYDRAIELKGYLEGEGINCVLQNVNLSNPVIASGVRVRIKETDLPKALRLIENVEIFTAHSAITELSGSKKRTILVPTDFSKLSEKACDLAFSIAKDHNAEVVLLHSFVDPSMTASIQLSDNLDFNIEETEMLETVAKDAENRMRELSELLRSRIKNGELPAVKFSRKIVEGLPEEAINNYAKEESPVLIVMGTRGMDKKERELIGSITAEVLDTCRSQILTISEKVDFANLDDVKNVVVFCTLDQGDLIAIDAVSRFCKNKALNVTLVVIPAKKQQINAEGAAEGLLKYCKEHYAGCNFSVKFFPIKSVAEDFNTLLKERDIDLYAVPNKKKNAFARLFNPGLAHRLLFRTDTPMIVIPV